MGTRSKIADTYRFIRAILVKARKDHVPLLAASLAYSSFLSLIPLIAVAYFFFDAFGGLDRMQGQMESFLIDKLAPAFSEQMMGYVDQVRHKISSGAIGIFGIFGFIITSFSMLFKIENALNIIWRVYTVRPMYRRITNHWTIITLGPIFIGVSLSLSTPALEWLKHDTGDISRVLVVLSTIIPYFMMSFLLSGIYILLPNTTVDRRSAIASGLLAGLAFELAKHAYAVYAVRALGHSVYGSLAVFPVFLVWMQFVWIIILGGAELSYFLHHTQVGPDKPAGKSLAEKNVTEKDATKKNVAGVKV